MGVSLLNDLRQRMEALERSDRANDRRLSTGWPLLDELLPGGGQRAASLVEWLADDMGTPTWSLAFRSLWNATQQRGGPLVILDPACELFPHGLPTWARPWNKFVFVRGVIQTEELWAWEQVLRSSAIRGVLGFLRRADDRSWRRLQLAAERGGTLAMIVRPSRARREPAWGDIRWWVESRPRPAPDPAIARREDGGRTRWMRIELLHARGGIPGRSIEVLWDDEKNALSLAPRLGDPATTLAAVGA